MKIKDIKTYVVGNPPPSRGGFNWIFIKLKTDGGLEGIGEAYMIPFHPQKAAMLIEDIGERFVIGANPFEIEKLWRKIYSSMYGQHPDFVKVAIISAFEIACWDIVGKETNQPIYNLLGGKYRDKLKSYTSIYPAPGDMSDTIIDCDPERLAKRAVDYVNRGFLTLKFDPLIDIWSPFNPQEVTIDKLDKAEAAVKAVREAVGSRCEIAIGTHGQMTTGSAIRFAKRLEKYEPLWIEEPVPPENINELARVAYATSIPIATGERLSTIYEFITLLERHAASIIQMSLGRSGGILTAKKVAAIAEAHFAQVAPHLYCGPIEEAANIQLDTCIPNFLIQETIDPGAGFYAEILKRPIDWQSGYFIPPTEPGLGIELNEEVMLSHPANDRIWA